MTLHFFFSLRQSLSLNLELTSCLDWLANGLQPPARLHPSTRVLDKCRHTGFYMVLGIGIQIFMVLYQALGQLSRCPCPPPCPPAWKYLCVGGYLFTFMCIGVCNSQRLIIQCPLLLIIKCPIKLLSTLFSGTRSPTEAGAPRLLCLALGSSRVCPRPVSGPGSSQP